MKLLISSHFSNKSLIGYDWDEDKVFWSYRRANLKACGMCYGRNGELWTAKGPHLNKVTVEGKQRFRVSPKRSIGSHSVKIFRNGNIGVADTGSSVIRVFNPEGKRISKISPIESIPYVPDHLHLNDFVETPIGLLATCFDYRPHQRVCYNKKKDGTSDYFNKGQALILNLSKNGKVVYCGLTCPHSMNYYNGYLYVFSSIIGILHKLSIDTTPFTEVKRWFIDAEKFIRGNYIVNENLMYIGGGWNRHTEYRRDISCRLYKLENDKIEYKKLDVIRAIYDILPWNDDIMKPLIAGSLRG